MNLKQRRIFYLSLIALFFVLAPLLLLYALGYNFSFFERKIVKTGFLVVNSYPRNSDLYLDNVFTKKRTPTNLPNLGPGDYEIELKKTGYQAWQKKLVILPNTATFADEITLFKNKPEKDLLVAEKILLSQIDENGRKIALVSENGAGQKISIVDLNNRTKKTLKDNFTFPAGNLAWFDDLLIVEKKEGDNSDYLILNTDLPEEISLAEITPQKFEKVIALTKNIFFGLSQGQVFKIDLENKKSEALVGVFATDITTDKNFLYLLSPGIEKTDLIQFKNSQLEKIDSFDQPYEEILNLKDGYLGLKNKKNFRLYRLNSSGENFLIEKEVKNASLNPARDKLLYYNENELWYFDLEDKISHLINRQAEPINEAIWYPINDYIIYLSGQSLKVTETDLRDGRNEYTLFAEKAGLKIHALYKTKYLLTEIKKEPSSELFLLKIQ